MHTISETVLDDKYQELCKLPLIANALDMLEEGLSEELCFHSSSHTKNVIHEALYFAMQEGVSESELTLVAIAAAYHDTGFINSHTDNEQEGAELASRAMQATGDYSPEEIELVKTMILDTRMVQTQTGAKQIASHQLSKYLLDADLSNLGREDFFERAELLRRELGVERHLFFTQAYKLLKNHTWQTKAATKSRSDQQQANLERLMHLMNELGIEPVDENEQIEGLSLERLLFLSKLPLLLNSSLETRKIACTALEHLKSILAAQAATLFILEPGSNELSFWALQGSASSRLVDKKMPADKGIVGWVIEKSEAVLIEDATNDPRFFAEIDREGDFKTEDLICVPLLVRGERPLGAIQVLNKRGDEPFSYEDLDFVQQFAHQMALSLENARLFQTLLVKNQKLETLQKRRKEMLTVIGHEFRTPLNVIQSAADLLASDMLRDKEAQTQMSETLQNGVKRLLKLLSQIQNLNSATRDEVSISIAAINTKELFDELQSFYSEVLKKRSLALKIDTDDTISAIEGDPALINIVLRNLISNAIRFTPDGGLITLATRREAGQAVVSVSDTGIGIAASELPLIFEKFYEVGSSLEHSSGDYEFKSGGLGLGLAAAQAILNRHGVSLDVDSKPEKGSRFYFRLPIKDNN